MDKNREVNTMWTEIATLAGAGALRNVAGWVENAFKDGRVSSYEWGQLGSTLLRVGVLGGASYWGLGIDLGASAGLAVGADFILSKLKLKK